MKPSPRSRRRKEADSKINRTILLGLGLCFHSLFASAQPPPALRPPRGEIAPTFWEQHGWQIIIVVVANIILIGVLIILFTRQKPKPPESPEVLARRSLAALRGRKVDGVLLMEVSRIFRRYVIFAFSLPPEELTTTELQNALQSRAREDVSAAIDFLRQCDDGKFSPMGTPPNSDPASRALELLEKIEICRRQALPQATTA
jgi:hypothetical protein